MKTLLFAVLSFLFLQTLCSARIGETFEQCTNRYGDGKNYTVKGSKVEFFKKMSKDNFMSIEIEFGQDGKAGRIVYSRELVNDGDPDRAPFNKYEIGAFLEANTGVGTIKKWKYKGAVDDIVGSSIRDYETWEYLDMEGKSLTPENFNKEITAYHFKQKTDGATYDFLELETREYSFYRAKIEKENEAKKGAASVQKLKGF